MIPSPTRTPAVTPRVFAGRGWQAVSVLIVGLAMAWLALGFLVGVNPDEEEYRYAIPSTLLAARALGHGAMAFWTSDIGLGVPQPFGQSLWMHPLMPLLLRLSVPAWVALFYSVHLLLAGLGGWAVARRVGASPLSAAMAVATYVLASPAQNYALTDFWPTIWLVYTLAPLLLLALLALLEAESARTRLGAACGAGLVAGVIGANGHQGNLIVYVVPMAAFLVAHVRNIARHWPWWLLAAVIAGVVAAPTIHHLSVETSLAPGILTRANYPETPTLDSLWDVFARPFGPHARTWFEVTQSRGTRVLFFGGPAAALALVYLVFIRRRLDLVCGAATALVLLNSSTAGSVRLISALHMFRDPLILFAAPCAALAVDWIAARGAWPRALAGAVVAAQLAVLGTAAWPFIADNLDTGLRADPPVATFVGDRPLAAWLRERAQASGGRLYYSAEVDARIYDAELESGGLGPNSMFYRGVPVVDGFVKGVAIDAVAPNDVAMRIKGQPNVPLDPTLLDVTGIRWVLALADEPVAPSLVARDQRQTGTLALVLYENPGARGAVFVQPAVRGARLPLAAGCEHTRLLCRDFSALAPLISPAATTIARRDSGIDIAFAAAPEPRWLLVGEMFRRDWRTTSGEAVESWLGGLIGVQVPAGATRVTLRYRPAAVVTLAAMSWITMGAAALVLLFTAARPSGRTRVPTLLT